MRCSVLSTISFGPLFLRVVAPKVCEFRQVGQMEEELGGLSCMEANSALVEVDLNNIFLVKDGLDVWHQPQGRLSHLMVWIFQTVCLSQGMLGVQSLRRLEDQDVGLFHLLLLGSGELLLG